MDERPILRCLVALPGLIDPGAPRAFSVIDLLDLPRWEANLWVFVALDPLDETRWLDWRAAHPEAV